MEIKTTRGAREPAKGDVVPAPEKSPYLRRRSAQKLGKSQTATRRLAALLPFFGKILFPVLLAAFGFSIFNYAYRSERFVLRKITFEGCKLTDTETLGAAIRQSFPRNLLQIDLARLRGRVEAEPWTRQAEIRRVLPSDLFISIEERTPSVILELKGELMLADDEGVLLDKYDTRYGKLDVPVFKGLLGENAGEYRLHREENSARVKRGRQMLAELEEGSPAFSKCVSEVDLSDRRDIRILLVDDAAEIHIGDRDFLKRFRNLMSNMPQYQELKSQYREIASVDLRFEGQIIYRPYRSPGAPAEVNVRPAANR